ncbi:hypothetical protein BJY00DRAFT_262707 [Aspergillus carlsbadensis]|nr:hypothetical protein BJY00DRAFT_262707 [Aspergillus carlsbadensis]
MASFKVNKRRLRHSDTSCSNFAVLLSMIILFTATQPKNICSLHSPKPAYQPKVYRCPRFYHIPRASTDSDSNSSKLGCQSNGILT